MTAFTEVRCKSPSAHLDSINAPPDALTPDSEGGRLRDQFGLLAEAQVAALLAVTVRTLASWRAEGIGPNYFQKTKKILYRRADVERWIEGNVVRLTPDLPTARRRHP
jgi:hypothetical protein